ncbi:MAG: tetratricopeptide repeat protein [Planctomycetota bacterium]|jgi:tetratricopeptide (TPR) repeat protein
MTKWVYFMTLFVGAAVCIWLVLLNARMATESSSAALELERSESDLTDLKERVRSAESQRDAANRKVEQLQREVAALSEQRTSDRQVLQDLWEMVLNNTRAKAVLAPAERQAIKQARQQIDREAEQQPPVKYGVEMIKQIISSGGGIEAAVRQIVTSDRIASTLEAHGEQPLYWAAAATLAHEPETAVAYLEEAAKLYPDSKVVLSSLVQAKIAQDSIDESLVAHIDEMQRIDPANALPDCYAAYSQFKSGDVEAALQSLSQAGAKNRFADDRIDLLMARYDYFLEAGTAEGTAIGLSAFDLPLSHMGMLQDMQVAEDVSNIGGSLSSAGRFLVYDRVGMAMQQSALERQRQIYEGRADTSQVEKIDAQLQAIDERSSMIDVMGQTFGTVMANMTEQDLANYVDGTVLNGEFSTLQAMPEIAEALARAQQVRESETQQTPRP